MAGFRLARHGGRGVYHASVSSSAISRALRTRAFGQDASLLSWPARGSDPGQPPKASRAAQAVLEASRYQSACPARVRLDVAAGCYTKLRHNRIGISHL